ncbi:hypothetical protein [Halogeometricum luteum]|uniref:Uncharacterized protein n=1 Tax=Halogeometricum luteum TaxID=2950537 RepID=A0ABU2G705_9EURY|nr:hypothetical protein [Halogeometricum sp. S3BR5-2]MDS0296577.1 hypothetical protein [Halogeometricum sp. S3BR5-2]
MSTRNQYSDLRYPLGVVGLIIVSFFLRAGIRRIIDGIVADSVSWVPLFGTVGQTVLIYSWAVSLFAFVLVPIVAFWLGMRYGQRSG